MKRRFVAALLCLLLPVSFAYGYVAHRNHFFPYRLILRTYLRLRTIPQLQAGVWSRFEDSPADENQARYQGSKASDVLAMPYLQGYRVVGDARRGVTLHQPAAYPGFNLYVSGDAPRATLVDMDGQTLHEWRYDFERLGPDFQISPDAEAYHYRKFWTGARLLDGGDLLAIFGDLALVKLDRNSRLLWARTGRFHHSVTVEKDGSVLALSRRRRIIPRINTEVAVLEDFVTVLDSNGSIQREVSLLDCFERSPYASLLNQVDRWNDPFHTNYLEVLDGSQAFKGAPFRKGNWMVSVPRLNTVAIVDPTAGRVVWALAGMWSGQHHPRLLADGNLLVFDNLGNAGRSRVIEVEPLSQQVVWEYPGENKADLYSQCCGGAERLPNGNTLIVEAANGRALEVTPDKHVVWEFVNPARQSGSDQLVATLFMLERLESQTRFDWLPPARSQKPSTSPSSVLTGPTVPARPSAAGGGS